MFVWWKTTNLIHFQFLRIWQNKILVFVFRSKKSKTQVSRHSYKNDTIYHAQGRNHCNCSTYSLQGIPKYLLIMTEQYFAFLLRVVHIVIVKQLQVIVYLILKLNTSSCCCVASKWLWIEKHRQKMMSKHHKTHQVYQQYSTGFIYFFYLGGGVS